MPTRTRAHFEQQAMPHLRSLYRLACQMAGADRAEDLVQEAYLRAWTHFDQFQPGTNCRAWLCRILHNTWVSEWRKTRLELAVGDLDDLPVDQAQNWEPEWVAAELSADLQWALAQLPAHYRWAVLLADVEELTYQETAAVMECPTGTVMSRLSRGRKLLGQLVREHRAGAARSPLKLVSRDGH